MPLRLAVTTPLITRGRDNDTSRLRNNERRGGGGGGGGGRSDQRRISIQDVVSIDCLLGEA